VLAITLLFFSAAIQAQSFSFVSGQLNGLSLTEKADLIINRYNGYSYVLHESIQPGSAGTFNFTKPLPEGFYQLSIPSAGIASPFYCTGAKNISISLTNAELQVDKVKYADDENKAFSDLLAASKHLEITINTLNEEFDPRQLDSFYVKRLPIHNQQVQLAYGDFNAAVERVKTKYPGTLTATLFSSFYQLPLLNQDKANSSNYDNQDAYLRDHFFDLWKLNDPRITRMPEVKSKLEKYFRFFARKNHGFLVKKCDELTGRTNNAKIKSYLASLLIDFFTQVKQNDIVAYVVENNLHGCLDDIDLSLINYTQNNLRGTKVSELELPNDKQQPVKLSDVYSKAKFTVLYFFSTDCSHCRAFHPIIKGLAEKYGRDLQVYDVCMEDDRKKWTDAIAEFALNFNNVNAANEARKQVKQLFGITYTPKIYVLNSAGEIVDKDLSIDDIGSSLSNLLSK
jgi:thiol-disulfide isomerase/thioredoxin